MARVSPDAARQLASSSDEWTAESWWQLEAAAFRDEPAVRTALSIRAPRHLRKFFLVGRSSPFQPLLALMQIASVTLPAIALVMLVSRHSDSVDILRSGILAGIAALLGVVSLVHYRRHPELTDVRTARLLGRLHLFPSLLTLIIATVLLVRGDADASSAWVLVLVVADIVVGLLHLLFHPRPVDPNAARARQLEEQLEAAIAGIDPKRQIEIRTDLAEAIKVLRTEGLIDSDSFERARAAPLGRLAATMN